MMTNIAEIERQMETLKGHYLAWTRDIQNIGLENITKHTRRLEWDLDATLTDCIVMDRRFWKKYNYPVIEELCTSFAFINGVCKDLKNMKRDFCEGDIPFSLLQELYTDWEKFKKSVSRTLSAVNMRQKRRKKCPWLDESKEKRKWE